MTTLPNPPGPAAPASAHAASISPVYAVASGKGGVGKTSLTLNLALLLARQGHKVLVMDADTGLANLDVQLNLSPTHDLSHVVAGQKDLAEIIVPSGHGFDVVPGRAGHSSLTRLPQPLQARLLADIRSLAAGYDLTLLDVSAGVDSQVLGWCAGADAALLVTTPDPSAFTDAYALLKLLWRDHGVANAQLIINQASAREAAQIHARLAQAAEHFLGLPELPLLGNVPPCRQYAQAVRLHQLAAVAFPHSSATAAIASLAAGLAPRQPR